MAVNSIIHGDKNEENIEVSEQCNIEIESNKTKKDEDNDDVVRITNDNLARPQCGTSEEPNQPLDDTNGVVVFDLET